MPIKSIRSLYQARPCFDPAAAGGGGGFTPLSLTNLAGWWKADVGVTTSGGNATAVTDQSGANNHLTHSGTVPFNASSAYNSKPAFDFAAANEASLVTGSSQIGTVVPAGNAFTAWGIGRMNVATDANGGFMVLGQAGGNDFNDPHNVVLISRTGSTASIETYYNTASPQIDTSMSTGANHNWVVTCDGTTFKHYIDGVAGSSGSGTLSFDVGFPPNVIIGNRWLVGAVAASSGWDGPICEAGLAFSFSDSTTVALLVAYLTGKWGS